MSDRPPSATRVLLAILAVLAAGAACSAVKPDLLRLYRGRVKPSRPLILIPGVFGSRLRDARTGRVVWGRAASFVERLYRPFHPDEDLLDLPIEAANPLDNHDDLVPDGVFDKIAGREYYQRLLNLLRDAGGYTPGDIRHPRPGEDLFAFDYDWRRDIAATAGDLASAIDRILAARGDPGGKVDLIGHSLGGLLARYYSRFGGRDVLGEESPVPSHEGAAHLGTVVFVATPNEGTLDALRSLLEGERVVRLLPPEAIFTMPAAFELLPAVGTDDLIDVSGDPVRGDLFDVATWERLGWSAFSPDAMERTRARFRKGRTREEAASLFDSRMEASRRFASWALERSRRLRRALEGELEEPASVRYIAFGGDCLPTPSRAVVIFDGEAYSTHFDPAEVPPEFRLPRLEELMQEPGDGTVTRVSLLGLPHGAGGAGRGLPLDASLFLCETHKGITQSATFHDNLLHALTRAAP